MLCCRGCTLCYGVVCGELLLGVYSQGVQCMTAPPGLLPATVRALHVPRAGGIKAETIIGGPIWALVRHSVRALEGYCLAGGLPPMLTAVQAGLGTAGCTLPW